MGDEPEAPRVEWKDGPAEPGPRVYTVTELPLHVQVAATIGWSRFEQSGRLDRPWMGYPPKAPIVGSKEMVPDYPTDWAATGPLIEEYALAVFHENYPESAPPHHWIAEARLESQHMPRTPNWVGGSTPLIAVCHLILKLAKEGKLHA